MIQEEEQAQEYFEETRDILWLFCLSGWIEQFQRLVEDFIQERLAKAAKIMEVLVVPGREGGKIICLHGSRCLVAGTIQGEELIQQPDYAFTCAKLDRAIIWDSKG
jgi:hypothetical protein